MVFPLVFILVSLIGATVTIRLHDDTDPATYPVYLAGLLAWISGSILALAALLALS